jgi:phosphoglucosamine mutase
MPSLQRAIRDCERKLRGQGRVLVRYSGTEPLIRIMLEGPDRSTLSRMSNELVGIFKKEIENHVH